MTEPAHPAKYSAPVMSAIVLALSRERVSGDILDPFAGVGRIHELRELSQGVWETYGVELEAEWAASSPWTLCGDATELPTEWSNTYAAVVTSPPYANRMADAYAGDAKERQCERCKGSGFSPAAGAPFSCTQCKGSGIVVGSRRHTYRIALGRPLTDGSAAGMQWGDNYRQTMWKALQEIYRVLRPGGLFLLNISDHVRGGALQLVPEWFGKCATSLHFEPVDVIPIATQRNRDGANGDLRATCEWLLVYRKPVAA